MMKNLDVSKLPMVALSEKACKEVNGGFFSSLTISLPVTMIAEMLGTVVDNSRRFGSIFR